jgi:hypothetical protein
LVERDEGRALTRANSTKQQEKCQRQSNDPAASGAKPGQIRSPASGEASLAPVRTRVLCIPAIFEVLIHWFHGKPKPIQKLSLSRSRYLPTPAPLPNSTRSQHRAPHCREGATDQEGKKPRRSRKTDRPRHEETRRKEEDGRTAGRNAEETGAGPAEAAPPRCEAGSGINRGKQ